MSPINTHIHTYAHNCLALGWVVVSSMAIRGLWRAASHPLLPTLLPGRSQSCAVGGCWRSSQAARAAASSFGGIVPQAAAGGIGPLFRFKSHGAHLLTEKGGKLLPVEPAVARQTAALETGGVRGRPPPRGGALPLGIAWLSPGFGFGGGGIHGCVSLPTCRAGPVWQDSSPGGPLRIPYRSVGPAGMHSTEMMFALHVVFALLMHKTGFENRDGCNDVGLLWLLDFRWAGWDGGGKLAAAFGRWVAFGSGSSQLHPTISSQPATAAKPMNYQYQYKHARVPACCGLAAPRRAAPALPPPKAASSLVLRSSPIAAANFLLPLFRRRNGVNAEADRPSVSKGIRRNRLLVGTKPTRLFEVGCTANWAFEQEEEAISPGSL